jgi:hypothetical protein
MSFDTGTRNIRAQGGGARRLLSLVPFEKSTTFASANVSSRFRSSSKRGSTT